MPRTDWTRRLLALAAAAAVLVIALLIRAAADGPLEQHSGTALYASMIYAGVFFLWPRTTPLVAGALATAFCWLVELSQLTGVPAYLSERSLLARLALGVAYDPLDMLWYPVGVLPLVAVHLLLRQRRATA
ncbi:DUF2809 domain-containing protein [Catellatospora sichuanensis]|uniref:ribosomal maturation YjgA family protein n=1 Tax=Catellatospora sichuanensis TaxID=1969805 RepID=UPI00118372A4|nr:DUF2809 domain-containing protein [Catellatospora sichuanensis]